MLNPFDAVVRDIAQSTRHAITCESYYATRRQVESGVDDFALAANVATFEYVGGRVDRLFRHYRGIHPRLKRSLRER